MLQEFRAEFDGAYAGEGRSILSVTVVAPEAPVVAIETADGTRIVAHGVAAL